MTFPRFIWENKTCSKAPIRMGLSENMASPKSSEIIIVFSLQLGDATHKLDPPIIEHVMASSVSEGGGLYLAKLAYFTNVSLGLCGISTYGVKVKLNQQRSLAGHHITHVLYIHVRRMPFTIWLVVLTILKNISQLGRIIPYIMENKKIGWNHQPAMIFEKHHHHWTILNIYMSHDSPMEDTRHIPISICKFDAFAFVPQLLYHLVLYIAMENLFFRNHRTK